jgi:hypothetical protein
VRTNPLAKLSTYTLNISLVNAEIGLIRSKRVKLLRTSEPRLPMSYPCSLLSRADSRIRRVRHAPGPVFRAVAHPTLRGWVSLNVLLATLALVRIRISAFIGLISYRHQMGVDDGAL